MVSVEGDEWMDGQMGGVWMRDSGSQLLLNKLRVFLGVSGEVAFTVFIATVPVITLRPWCPCNKMMINDREER